jgi:hypothetical protein
MSSRLTTNATSTLHIKVGFVHLANSTTQSNIVETYNALIKRFCLRLVSASPVRTVSATLLTHLTHDMSHVTLMYHSHRVSAQSAAIGRPEYQDDGFGSDDVDGQSTWRGFG